MTVEGRNMYLIVSESGLVWR